MKYYAGIDIGGTSTTIGLVSEKGEILNRKVLYIKDFERGPIENFLEAVAEQVRELCREVGQGISGAGVGAPNSNYYKGAMEKAPNMPWKEIYPIRDLLEKEMGIKVVVTNDANAAAIGEMKFGVAKGMKDFILFTLGTGLGSGIVVQGEVLYGHDGFAGELGHSVLIPKGRDCPCGRKGCLEAYVSIRGIMDTYRELGGKQARNPKEIAELAEKADPISAETYVKTGEYLGLKLADVATYTSPEAYILFGGIAEAWDLFIPSLQKTMEENLHNLYRGKIRILRSGLPANDAALLGAAALVTGS